MFTPIIPHFSSNDCKTSGSLRVPDQVLPLVNHTTVNLKLSNEDETKSAQNFRQGDTILSKHTGDNSHIGAEMKRPFILQPPFKVSSNGLTSSTQRPPIPANIQAFLTKTPEQEKVLDDLKSVLAIPPAERDDEGLDKMYEWMQKNCMKYSNNIFGSAPEYIRREICRQMKIVRLSSKQLLIRQGDTGDTCYIVINGVVDVYVKPPDAALKSTDSATENGVYNRRNSNIIGGRHRMLMRGMLGATETNLNIDPTKEFGPMVASLGPGAMFGEVVLNNPTARRNATILASQYCDSCDLIVLERHDYIRLVRTSSMEASHYTYAGILDQMYLFRNWDKNAKMRLVSAMHSMEFLANTRLYQAGEYAQWMYVIITGEVMERIYTNLTLCDKVLPTIHASPLDQQKKLMKSLKVPIKLPSKGGAPGLKVMIDMALIGAGDLAGEWPFVMNYRASNFDLRAVTDVKVLAIDRRYYEAHMAGATRENSPKIYETIKMLKKIAKERSEWRKQRIECGNAYPEAHIVITWELMQFSGYRCARCGHVGHIGTYGSKCEGAKSSKLSSEIVSEVPTKDSTVKLLRFKKVKSPGRAVRRKNNTATHEPNDTVLQELYDINFLPSAKDQLKLCRNLIKSTEIPSS